MPKLAFLHLVPPLPDYLTIPLRFIDPPDEGPSLKLDPPALGCVIEPTEARGKLAGRFLLRPNLDLGRYTVNAKIDWVRLAFTTGRHTSWKAVGDAMEHHTGARPRVTGPEGRLRYSGTSFLATIQDPEVGSLARALGELKSRMNIRAPGFGAFAIEGIEISVDWRPTSGHDRERWLMVEALRRHHLVHQIVYTGQGDQPRSYIRRGKMEFALKKPTPTMKQPEAVDGVMLAANPERRRDLRYQSHVQLPVDRTYYVGARKGEVMFRIMDKVSDQKDPAKQTRVELEQHERSARIEVALDQCVPEVLGLDTVDHLIGFRFGKLRDLLFDFWLPTVSAGKGRGVLKPDRKELEVFRRTGVFGLERYQRAAWDRHEEMRGLGLVRGRSPDMGKKGYRVVYGSTEAGGGMNKRVEQALTHLTTRWSKKALGRTMACMK